MQPLRPDRVPDKRRLDSSNCSRRLGSPNALVDAAFLITRKHFWRPICLKVCTILIRGQRAQSKWCLPQTEEFLSFISELWSPCVKSSQFIRLSARPGSGPRHYRACRGCRGALRGRHSHAANPDYQPGGAREGRLLAVMSELLLRRWIACLPVSFDALCMFCPSLFFPPSTSRSRLPPEKSRKLLKSRDPLTLSFWLRAMMSW